LPGLFGNLNKIDETTPPVKPEWKES
jgi:hypothetical protein